MLAICAAVSQSLERTRISATGRPWNVAEEGSPVSIPSRFLATEAGVGAGTEAGTNKHLADTEPN
jgi:hypothetical protein